MVITLLESSIVNKIHIGYHKAGSTFLQCLVFPEVPGYQGRFYTHSKDDKSKFVKDESCFLAKSSQGLEKLGQVIGACKKIIKHYEKKENIFISTELFSKLPHDKLISIIDPDKWNVLIVERKFEDIFSSRKNHRAKAFFLQEDINKNRNIKKIQEFYNGQKLSQKFKHSTVISFERFFSGDPVEIEKLSNYLDFDVSQVVLQNLSKKINTREENYRKGW